jgi:hypothetical protein
MKVHMIIVLVVDHDDLGPTGVKLEIENANYPNDCIRPTVMEVVTREVEWSDDHPLNKFSTLRGEFQRLFPRG